MSENLRAFFEYVSAQEEGVRAEVATLKADALIAYAAEKGFALTLSDFAEDVDDDEGEVSLDEADAVAGGGSCYCAVGGGGTEDLNEYNTGEKTCACVVYGQGDEVNRGEALYARCVCAFGGYGEG